MNLVIEEPYGVAEEVAGTILAEADIVMVG